MNAQTVFTETAFIAYQSEDLLCVQKCAEAKPL